MGAWFMKHETALPHTIHLETIRPQFSSSGTHRINTRRNVTVPDVSVFHHKEPIVLRLGAWLCKHETALPSHNSLRPSVPSSPALALTESIHVGMSLYWCQCIPSQEVNVLRLGAWYVSMRLSPSHNSFGDHPSPSCAALASQNQYKYKCHCTWCQCIPSQEVNCVSIGAWLCKHETALPHTIHLETIRPSCAALALTESIP